MNEKYYKTPNGRYEYERIMAFKVGSVSYCKIKNGIVYLWENHWKRSSNNAEYIIAISKELSEEEFLIETRL